MYAALQHLIQVANLSSGVVEKLNNCIGIVRLSKGSFLIKQGQHCEHIYIIEDGFARIFSIIEYKEITTLFAKENDIITSTYSLFTKKRSNESIEVLEDSVLIKINYDELINLCKQYPELFNLYRIVMEKYYLLLEERTLSLQFDTALERYQKLLSQFPFLLQRASLGQIASYLGMSPVTLSRMRGKV